MTGRNLSQIPCGASTINGLSTDPGAVASIKFKSLVDEISSFEMGSLMTTSSLSVVRNLLTNVIFTAALRSSISGASLSITTFATADVPTFTQTFISSYRCDIVVLKKCESLKSGSARASSTRLATTLLNQEYSEFAEISSKKR
jgi:hypothetical protein